ncbi:hypothetical protein BT96DRAFT_1008143 [Gymnopus androsaceus JB14]|uniref:RRM domain-containing protein n=1 Tax=Gymnopus androsaceus JB14 TaxID=1447944 RepID=A0A6A4GFL6_9AGAR|nr:hypothetical protein BT96DRAFT_1008143 [Gymnopus androsaceus JB14]
MGQLLGLPMYHQAQVMSQYPMHLAPAHFPMEGSLPAPSNVPSKVSTPAPTPLETTIPKACSICARKPPNLTRLAILAPYMECAGCRGKVADFKLVSITADEGSAKSTATTANATSAKPQVGVFDNMLSTPDGDHSFDFGSMNEPDFFSDGGIRASTRLPRPEDGRDAVVLRIDNVPWDITPPRISAWLGQPVVRVHVLLDRKGKTMSHAFVEVENETIAGKILRGEVESTGLRRGSVLGNGKRARGVTVTRSSQGELMAALFPSWLGCFDGSRPSLAGVDNDLSLYLIRSPDAHFLKVPSLPFHSLISVLAKFPADIDSRVFWTSSLRDLLFDAVFAAIQVLVARIEQRKSESDDGAYPPDLVDALTRVALDCKAFTSQQKAKITSFFNKEPARPSSASGSSSGHSSASSHSGSADPTDADVEDEDGENDADGDAFLSDDSGSRASSSSELRTPSSATAANSTPSSPAPSSAPAPAPAAVQDHMLDDLAREFGVEAQLVEALMQRLSLQNQNQPR